MSSQVIPSPLKTLVPFISAEEAAMMAYPPYAVPGTRDVNTSYGSMRVYEWGPEDGDKVLFVHGDATPSLLFTQIAQRLVDVGYRVMLFDLWGRGYSDSPVGVKHDVHLFATQISLALSSSPLSWVNDKFYIVGYSLGGPISLQFTGTFPNAVRSVVLFGPAGLLRTLPAGYENPILHNPEDASDEEIREAVRLILEVEPSPPPREAARRGTVLDESPGRVEQTFDMAGLLQWQFDYHKGHVYSFQDTVRYGPLQHQESVWSKVCDIIAGRTQPESPLHGKKLLVIFGQDDTVVVPSETVEDISQLLPSDHLQVEYVPGGHGFVYPNSETITQTMLSFWDAGDVSSVL